MARRRFQRTSGERRYRKIFFVATEGAKTEPQYFSLFNSDNSVVHVKLLKGRHDSDPLHVLKRIQSHIKQRGIKATDEAWLVVDRDCWTEQQLKLLYEWTKGIENYGFALSNPKFEYWLLLHFEDGNAIANSKDCSTRLTRYLPAYNKGIDPQKFSRQMILDAIERAKRRDNPPCEEWPRDIGQSTVYRLVESILGAG